MQHSTEALQQEIKALEERLQQARRALQELQGGLTLDDGLELIELSENDIVFEPEQDQLVERLAAPVIPVADPWAGVSVAEPDAVPGTVVPDNVSVETVWPESAPAGRDPLMTGTLAELYVSQGFTDKAVQIYRDILAVEPGNAGVAARLAELEAQQSAGLSDETPETVAALPAHGVADQSSTLSVLEGWLENIRRIRECR